MSIEALFLISFILLITEAFIPSLGILGFGGFVAFLSAVIILINEGQTHFYGLSIQSIIALGVLVFSSFAVCGYFVLKSFKKKIETGIEYMHGQQAEVKSWSKGKGIITFEGEDWKAISQDNDIKTNDIVTITGYNKLTLTVKKDD